MADHPERHVPGDDPEWVIRTGIPAIDGMLRIREHEQADRRGGIGLPDLETTTSLCIIGPEGTGKSVLAMHIASRYLADCHEAARHGSGECPRVCYVSTDMTHAAAKPMLKGFALDRPNARQVPFTDPQVLTDERGDLLVPDWLRRRSGSGASTFDRELRITLEECPADNPDDLARFVLNGRIGGDSAALPIAFVDLASRTAGDDWAFVHRLLGVLPDLGAHSPRHLVVIDASEGLETFGGDLNAFGERSPRRARIAKLMRLATGRCHLVAIVEEAADRVRLPEEFVSDVVFRLRNVDADGYLRRTLQIEKARGQSTVRGRHPYVIRSGRGSTTGRAQNWDDPQVFQPGCDDAFQSYVELFPSLHYLSRNLMAASGSGRAAGSPACAGFGIEYLDDMLAEPGHSPCCGSDDRGLPCSTITALIGDAGTQKTGLGIAFLGQAFGGTVAQLLADGRAGRLPKLETPEQCAAEIRARYSDLAGVPILITTQNESGEALVEYFLKKLFDPPGAPEPAPADPWREGLGEFMRARTICRRLEIHDMPSPVLFNIIKRAVEAGQRIANGGDPNPVAPHGSAWDPGSRTRLQNAWRIRLVIDDLSTIMDTYAQVRSDPLFLPFLLFYLRREHPTSLIIDTRAGRPDAVTVDGFHTDLRALTDHRLYTWPVTEFYGDHRVAIAAIPPIARDRRARVREVIRRGSQGLDGRGELLVDPVFELYLDLEKNKPQRVPLEVRLYAETEACREYSAYLNEIFTRVFRPDPDRRDHPGDVVISEQVEDYSIIRDASYLKIDTRLDHTLIVQIDEFWPQGHSGELERQYLLEDVGTGQPRYQRKIRDPYRTYREKHLFFPRDGRDYKAKYFAAPDCDVSDPRSLQIDRVPFAWDFGFMACREAAWQMAAAGDPGLRHFWQWYSRTAAAGSPEPEEGLTWRNFLQHACAVAAVETQIRNKHVPAFDLSLMAPESFSCLVLEVWLSEICLTLQNHGKGDAADRLAAQLGERHWLHRDRSQNPERTAGLLEWLRPGAKGRLIDAAEPARLPGWSLELYKTWLLLVEALDLESLSNPRFRYGFPPNRLADATAVSVRHWYKTACAVSDKDREVMGPVFYGRLPGRFTTRGDWFLTVAPESRSYPLASRALDLLCSVRGNMRRLERGIGLPTRRLTPHGGTAEADAAALTFRSRLTSQRGPFATSESLSYADILALGARPAEATAGEPTAKWEERSGRLGWLWRSGLKNYHRHALTWHSWLYRVAGDWRQLKEAKGAAWKTGFDVYDDVDRAADPAELEKATAGLESFDAFLRSLQELVNELRLIDAQVPDEGRDPA